MAKSPEEILDFWFSAEMKPAWFQSTPELDQELKQRFESTWEMAAKGLLDDWRLTAEGCLALGIVLDQFPLNMFRGDAKSFSTELLAVEVCLTAVKQGLDQKIDTDKLAFLYMPLMHSENMDYQDLSIELFNKANLKENLRFAKHHREIVKKYGRFPHRNKILGRVSTQEELDYLNSPQAFTG